ncbi:hypothetical protein K502DRAFT_365189 [Neoconidiobolus thromboides FSU 785]|nr:hypothetical protein K502DRAFT_365189 [Neoconidiobolus thromboides FSU 785]
MSCDLSEASIAESYQKILNREISWFVLGYGDTREKLFLYSKGLGDVEDLKKNLIDSIHYALLLYNDHLVYVLYVDENLSGVRRARTVVHGRSVSAFFEQIDVSLHITNLDNLTVEAVENAIKNKAGNAISEPKENGNLADIIASSAGTITGAYPSESNPSDIYPSETILSAGDHDTEDSNILFNPNSSAFNQSTPVFEEESTLPKELPAKINLEEEAKRKIQEAWQKRQSVRLQFTNLPDEDASQIMDYITVQGDGSYFWKRRWYVIRGETIYFYRDPIEKYPISCLDLGSGKVYVKECSIDTLIPNSFHLSIDKGETKDELLFFSDSNAQMQSAIKAIQSNSMSY